MKLIKIMILMILAVSYSSHAKDVDCLDYKNINCYKAISADSQDSISVYELFGKFKALNDHYSDSRMDIWEFDDCSLTKYSVYKGAFNRDYNISSKYIDLSKVNINNIIFFKPNGELHFDYGVTRYPGNFHIDIWHPKTGLTDKDSALAHAKKQAAKAIKLGKTNKQHIRKIFNKRKNNSFKYTGHDNVTFRWRDRFPLSEENRWRDRFPLSEEKAVLFMKLTKACGKAR